MRELVMVLTDADVEIVEEVEIASVSFPEFEGFVRRLKVDVVCDANQVNVEVGSVYAGSLFSKDDSASASYDIIPRQISTNYAGAKDDGVGNVNRVPWYNVGRIHFVITPSIAWEGSVTARMLIEEV